MLLPYIRHQHKLMMLMTLHADKVPNLGLVETIDTEKVFTKLFV